MIILPNRLAETLPALHQHEAVSVAAFILPLASSTDPRACLLFQMLDMLPSTNVEGSPSRRRYLNAVTSG